MKMRIKLRIADVIGILTLSVVILIAIVIGANLQDVVNDLNLSAISSEAASTASTVFSNFWTGMVLASIGIIVAAAVGLIALVLGSFSPPGE